VKMLLKLRALASRALNGAPRFQRSRIVASSDDHGALGDPGGDRQRRDPHAGTVEGEPHLAGGAVRRDGVGRGDVVVGAAVLIEGDQQRGVEVV
jgi:hypothetical protein